MHNHWAVGSDEKPGQPNCNDDRRGIKDDHVDDGPGELGCDIGYFDPGDLGCTGATTCPQDIPLHDENGPTQAWPTSFGPLPFSTLPDCWASGEPIDDQAVDLTPRQQDHRISVDWGSPGKQHKTRDYDD
jgi:hypothetical protein